MEVSISVPVGHVLSLPNRYQICLSSYLMEVTYDEAEGIDCQDTVMTKNLRKAEPASGKSVFQFLVATLI